MCLELSEYYILLILIYIESVLRKPNDKSSNLAKMWLYYVSKDIFSLPGWIEMFVIFVQQCLVRKKHYTMKRAVG
jgi:hypothetical protein